MITLLKLRRYSVILLMFAAIFVVSKDASAQNYAGTVKNYIYTQFSQSYSSIVGQAGTSYLGNGAYPYYSYPYYYTTAALPFNFGYDSVNYTQGTTMYIHDNSAVSFSYSGNWDYGYSISNGYQASFPKYINPWGMVYYPYSYSSGIYSQVSGISPFRVWTLEFPNVYTYYSNSAVSVQVKFYETTNAIEFWYSGNNQNMSYGYIGDIGMNGATNGDYIGYNTAYNYFVYQNPFYTPPTQLRFGPKQLTNIQLSVQPKVLSFGSVQAGITSPPLCANVTNTGTIGNLIINSATITGASDFKLVSSPPSNTYPVGSASGQYCIAFTPTTYGLRTATLTIASNGQDSGVQSITLNGIGTVADYTIDSTTRFKKTRTRLGQSLTQYLHITSTGQNPLNFSSFIINGSDGGQYAVTYTPVNPLLPGNSDSIGITYTPTLEGKHVATMTITSNSFTYPTLTISMQGTGILPHIVLTPPILLFDSTKEGQTVCKNIDIWNPGSDTLKISANYLSSNDGDFHYTGLSGTDVNIPPDQTKTVNVCFIPLQQGFRQGRITLKTNIIPTFDTPRQDTAGLLTIDLRGTGVPYGVFGNALSGSPFTDSSLVGVSVCRTDTLKNNGDADIMVTGITISGTNGSDFTYSNLPAFPFLLKARTFITFKACGTPDQQGLLSATGTVTGTTAGTAITMTLPLAIFGFKPCIQPSPISLFDGLVLPNNGSDSTICDTIFNCGDIDAIYHVGISGTSQADYTVTPSVSGTVPAHTGSAVFCVKYKPSAIGTSLASLDVTTTDGSVSAKVPLNGAAGCATLTHDAPSVPNTGENGTAPFTFMITNTGTTPWSPGMPTISGSGAGSYQVISVVPDPVPPGGQATVTVQFHPPLGSAGQTLTANITWPNGLPCQSSVLSVDLSGQSIVSSVQFATTTDGFSLEQSYPNPTQGSASFNYTTPKESAVRITVVDLTGNLVRTLITGRVSEGMHTVNFDVRDLVSGTYAYVLESGTTRLVRQFILAK